MAFVFGVLAGNFGAQLVSADLFHRTVVVAERISNVQAALPNAQPVSIPTRPERRDPTIIDIVALDSRLRKLAGEVSATASVWEDAASKVYNDARQQFNQLTK